MTLLDYLKSKVPAGQVFHKQDGAAYIDLEELYGIHEKGRDLQMVQEALEALIEGLSEMYWAGVEAHYLTEEQLSQLNSIELRIDPEAEDYDTSVRRPYYQMRGRPVTPEQARDIIRRTDELIDDLKCPAPVSGFIGAINFNQWWFSRNHHPTHYGWSHPDGTIGCNAITQRWPNFTELLTELLRWKLAFPYLDLTIAISRWDELPGYAWDAQHEHFQKRLSRDYEKLSEKDKRAHDREREQYLYMDYPDFCENLEIGVCTHDNVIEFLSPKNAARRYREYAARYEAADRRVYVPEYYEEQGLLICDNAYLRQCLRDGGLSEEQIEKTLAARDCC